MCLWGWQGGANGQVRAGRPSHPANPCLAPASPCVEEVFIHNVLERDADPGWQLPEEARRELPTDLGNGQPRLLRHHVEEAACSTPIPLTKGRATPLGSSPATQAYFLPTITRVVQALEGVNGLRLSLHQGPMPPSQLHSLRAPLACGFPGGSDDKEPACKCRRRKRHGSIPGSGRSPGEGNGNPFQYSCLENSTDRGGWQAIVHGVTKSWTQLSD